MQQPYVRRSYRRVDQRPIDVAPAADHSRRRRYTNIAAVVVAGLVAMRAASLIAEQTDATETKGQARVVERKGPEVEIRPGARAQVVVLFTHSAAQPGGAQQQGHFGGVEVVLVESEMAAASGDQQQQQQGQARPTGREITFVEADAVRGVVSHAFEHSGNGRRMMVLARVNGKYVDVQQSGGGGEGVTLLTVPMPQQQQQAQGQQSGGQPAGDGAAAAPAEAQQQPQPQQPPGQAAVIMMYTGGGGATQQ